MTQSPLHTAERSLLGDIMTSDTLWSSLLVLCDDCNGRFVGSDDEQRAAAFIRQSFEQYGLSNAHIADFPLRGW
ncbi:MAG: M28 family peptidase, partial [Candidatus Roseilinea sp.]